MFGVVMHPDYTSKASFNGSSPTTNTPTPVGEKIVMTGRAGMGVVGVTGVVNIPGAAGGWARFGAILDRIANGSTKAPGATSKVYALTIRDITESFNAAGSATASATSASNAAASETAAGQSATAASGSATTAATRAGEALTYRNQAASSAADAAGAAVTASQASGTAASARDDAQAAAATAVTQSASASASAAEASINANIAASVGGGGVVKDPTFNNWPAADPRPVGVAAPVGNLALARQTVNVIYGDKALRMNDTGGGNAYFALVDTAHAPASDSLHWVVEYVVTVNSGDLRRFGVQFRANRSTDYYGATVDLAANHPTTVVGSTYRGSQLFQVNPTGSPSGATTTCQSWFYTNLSSFSGGAYSAKNLTLHKLQFRPATPEEVAAGKVLPEVEGRLAIVAEVAADAAEQIGSARFRVTGDGGAEPFDISLEAGPDGSAASLTAKAIRLRNIVNGQAINVVEVVGGKARFSGDVQIDGNLVLDGTLNGRRVMVPDTVTPMAATYAAGSIGLNGTTATQVQEVWVTTQGGPVVVEFNGLINMRHDPSGSFNAVMEVRRSPNTGTGIQMLYMSVPALGGGNDSVLGMYPLKLIDRPAAGTWRYFVTVWSTTNNMTIQEVRQRFMSALEYRTNS